MTVTLVLATGLLVALFLLFLAQAANSDLVDELRAERESHRDTLTQLAAYAPRRRPLRAVGPGRPGDGVPQ